MFPNFPFLSAIPLHSLDFSTAHKATRSLEPDITTFSSLRDDSRNPTICTSFRYPYSFLKRQLANTKSVLSCLIPLKRDCYVVKMADKQRSPTEQMSVKRELPAKYVPDATRLQRGLEMQLKEAMFTIQVRDPYGSPLHLHAVPLTRATDEE